MKNLIFLCVLCFLSCSPKNILDLFDNIDEIQGDSLNFSLFLGNPTQIVKIDSFLLIVDEYDDYLLTIVNLSSGEARRALQQGRGPNELMGPILISQLINDSIINILERRTSTIVKFKIRDVLFEEYPSILEKITLEGGAMVPQEAENYLVALGQNEKMLSIYDKDGKKLNEFIPYPKEAERFQNPMDRFITYQSDIKISNNGTKLVQAGLYYDLLNFYHIYNEQIVENKRYFFNDASIGFENNQTKMLFDTKIHFISLYPTNDKIYASYSGNIIKGENKEYHLLCLIGTENPLKHTNLINRYILFGLMKQVQRCLD